MVYEDIDSLLRVRNVKMSSEINPADRGGEGPRRQREAIWMPKKRGRKGLRVLQFPEKPDTVVEGWVDIDKMRIPGNPWCLSRDLAMLYFEYRGRIWCVCRKCGHAATSYTIRGSEGVEDFEVAESEAPSRAARAQGRGHQEDRPKAEEGRGGGQGMGGVVEE